MTIAIVTWGYSTKTFDSAEAAHTFRRWLAARYPALVIQVRVLRGA